MRKSKVNNTWVKTCKICKLFVTHKELWIELHRMILEEKKTYADVTRWFDTKLQLNNTMLEDPSNEEDPLFLTPLKPWNFQSHFTGSPAQPGEQPKTGHATDFYTVRRIVEEKEGNEDMKAAREAEDLVGALQIPGSKKALDSRELNEYISLASMVRNLEAILHQYDNVIKDKIDSDKRITIKDIEDYQKQVQGLIDIQVKMASLRNTKAITGSAIDSSIELIATNFLEKLITVVREAKALLEAEMSGSSLPKEIETLILHTLKDAMKAAIPEIRKQVLSQYRIKK